MAVPVLYGFNLLAQTGVTVTVSGEVAGKPKERMWDSDAGPEYEDTSNAGTRIVKSDQGAGGTALLGALCVAPNHNLGGATVAIESSPDDAIWTTRGTLVVPAGTAAFRIDPSLTWTTRFSRATITGAAAAPKITEMAFTKPVSLVRHPSERGIRQGLVGNVRRTVSMSGKVWKAVRGDPRAAIEYLVRDLQQSPDRANLEALFRDIKGGARFLFILDADAVVRWVEWLNPDILFDPAAVDRHDVVLRFEEPVN